ncbi:TIGR04141 family sporadically distributed protein [bacterium]|nr:TIGR04141 family sporadically distributed protein [bacterium]MBI9073749.1 TIGR04141 family sporadically distributed protein [Melioribacteraceae bacterium]
MSDNHRIKIFLVKKDINDTDENLLKYEEGDANYPELLFLYDEEETVLYYRAYGGRNPGWFRTYLGKDKTDANLVVSYAMGLIFRTIEYKGENRKFAITFGAGDNMLDMEKFEDRFGMKIVLNLADKIYSVNKKSVSSTMSRSKESATHEQTLNEFVFDIEQDLLYGVTVKAKSNDFAIGNMSGRESLSLVTHFGFEDLNILLEKCMNTYEEDTYKEEYSFIDNMKEITEKNPLIPKIYDEILKAFFAEDTGKVWFSVPEDINWDVFESFSLYRGNATEKNLASAIEVDSIDYDVIHGYLETDLGEVEKLEDLKRYKVIINSTDGSLEHIKWKVFNCMYASVLVDDSQYVLNDGRIFEIRKEFYRQYEGEYEKLDVFPALMPYTTEKNEAEYNKNVYESDKEKYILLDHREFSESGRKLEICDLFDKTEKSFIHIKRYGSSSVLSHLFSQAAVSADLFKDGYFHDKILKKINDENTNEKIDSLSSNECNVIMGIVTSKEIPVSGKSHIPFFSKVNVVRTVNQIKKWGYPKVGLTFISYKK